ncbi:MFS transporter [Gordonia desulfuricans]|uniref:MFS transporter n=1 Tax=Gordonia desulfuricans TaxID=89051 RepID=UPI00192E79AF
MFASWIGTTIEYYDNAAYGLAASVVFAPLFFPSTNPVVGTLLSLGSFGVGFVARPVGALVFGHFGDRIGRKGTLMVTLITMGIATFCIGLLPTYDSIGIMAPILLMVCRIFQGISVGGEYGGAVLMTVEHTDQAKRGFFGALVNSGATAGLVLANVAFLAVFSLPDDIMLGWAWRIPFLFSAVLVVIGIFVRRAVDESPDFVQAKAEGELAKVPIVEAVRTSWRPMILIAFAILATGVAFTMGSVYSVTYGTSALGLDKDTMIAVLLPAAVYVLITIPLWGMLGDQIGARRLFLLSAASLIVLPFIWFALTDTREYWLMLLGLCLLFTGHSANYSVVPALFSDAFPPAVRYSAMSIGFTVGLIFGNACAPAISAYLLDVTGGSTAIALYMGINAAIAMTAGFFLRPARKGNAPTSGDEAIPASGSRPASVAPVVLPARDAQPSPCSDRIFEAEGGSA